MATSEIFFDNDETSAKIENNNNNTQPENEFWERTQNELDQLEKDFPDNPALNDLSSNLPNGASSTDPFDEDDLFPTDNSENNAHLTNGNNLIEPNNAEFDFNDDNNLGESHSTQGKPDPYKKRGDFSAISKEDKIYKEPEKIKIWREKQQEILKEKDQEEEIKKKEMREHAKKELEEWQSMYKQQVSKAKENNRIQEKEFQQSHNRENIKSNITREKNEKTADMINKDKKEWEKVASLCDFNPKNSKHVKDVTRLRSVIVKLKSSQASSPRQHGAKNTSLPNGPHNTNGDLHGDHADSEDEKSN
ncbi:unnamed protein product [Gordionus sp. m RMFG-2023]|uniref:clathrin light chain-like n=1 Tax=Gordionus sp. m RMFG-2023 TaxID=3053472 RepID=UPI0030DF70F0